MENNFEPRVGAKFQFHTKPGPGFNGIVDCEVLEVDAPRRLSYSWRGGWSSKPTIVTFTLVPEEGGTRLLLQHTGFEGSRAIALSYLLGSGWGRLLNKDLPRVLRADGQATIMKRKA
jgi:uncharacterized protein YndB with AHSA1/START domain